jgi:hypothetical protein
VTLVTLVCAIWHCPYGDRERHYFVKIARDMAMKVYAPSAPSVQSLSKGTFAWSISSQLFADGYIEEMDGEDCHALA